jgi:hypothetical protein
MRALCWAFILLGLSADMLRYTTMKHAHGMTRYHYRGMLVGSSFRYSGSGPFDPTELWKVWDSFGIEDSETIGWWEDVEAEAEEGEGAVSLAVPVQASHPDFKVTVYLKKGTAAMVVLAGWGHAASSETPTAGKGKATMRLGGGGGGTVAGWCITKVASQSILVLDS